MQHRPYLKSHVSSEIVWFCCCCCCFFPLFENQTIKSVGRQRGLLKPVESASSYSRDYLHLVSDVISPVASALRQPRSCKIASTQIPFQLYSRFSRFQVRKSF